MHEILTDIKDKLKQGKYKNEEHVRLSLVCRLLFKIGWNIWDPEEVNTEFSTVPKEDKTKVDIALFVKDKKSSKSIFVEVKAVGKITTSSLAEIERQVRDYNKNHTALFSIITDGRNWRLYYSQTGGEFHDKCFKVCDLLYDDLEDIEQTFSLFFSKENLINGHAEEQAGKYLQLTNKQKAIQDSLSQAKRLVQVSPYPSLPQAIVEIVKNNGIVLTVTEVEKLLERIPKPQASAPISHPPILHTGLDTIAFSKLKTSNSRIPLLNADNPGDLHHTRVEGTIGGEYANKWINLVKIGIRLAINRGYDFHILNLCLPSNIKEGIYTNEGYSPMKNINLSIQNMDANDSAKTLVLLAKKLNCHLELTVLWNEKSLHAGEQGIIRWSP
jgi:predicted type IV restriction endonuclease